MKKLALGAVLLTTSALAQDRSFQAYQIVCSEQFSNSILATIRFGRYDDDGSLTSVGAVKIPPSERYEIAHVSMQGINLRIDWNPDEDGTGFNFAIMTRSGSSTYYDFTLSDTAEPSAILSCSEPQLAVAYNADEMRDLPSLPTQ